MNTSTTPSILLVVSSDATLAVETRAAMSNAATSSAAIGDESAGAGAAPLIVAVEPRQAVEVARVRRPRVVLLELAGDLARTLDLAQQLSAAAPHALLAGAYRGRALSDLVPESDQVLTLMRNGLVDCVRRPLAPADLERLLSRGRLPGKTAEAPHGAVVAFISNKGGVGKSTTAVNVACGLAKRHPGRVLLIDAALQLGVCASLLDLQPTATLTDATRQRQRLDETLLAEFTTPHDCGLALLAAPRDAVEAAEIDDDDVARLIGIARRRYDFVILDTFPMFDRVTVAILDLSDMAYLVLEAVVPTVLGAIRLLELLDSLAHPPERRRILLNRFAKVSGGLSPTDVAQRLRRDVEHVLPFDSKIIAAANSGRPVALGRGGWFGYLPRLRRLIDEVESLNGDPASVRPGTASGERGE
ncbi:MAG TPA: AAA family ATPase [Pirellulaceae bacterium]|nr:AAA family ATPase [Pirellulaceae bacterium]